MNSHHVFDGAVPQGSSHPGLRWALGNGLADSLLPVRKSRGTLLSQAQFQTEAARRRVDQIEAMISDIERGSKSLDDEIRAEENRTGLRDPTHFVYPTYAKATIARRDNLNRSADVLKDLLSEAKLALAKALARVEEADGLRVQVAEPARCIRTSTPDALALSEHSTK